MKQILAIGGGGFQEEGDASPIDDYIIQLTGKQKPRICLVSTTSGDRVEYIERFCRAFSRRCCEPSHLAFFFREPRPGAISLNDLRTALLAPDAICVSGGNARAAIAIWREWKIDQIFAEALDKGILLVGMSAGAMCWFEYGLTDTYFEAGYRPLPCLGFIPGACRVHYDAGPLPRQRLHAALALGAVPATIAIDDLAAVLFRNAMVDKVLSWSAQSTAYRVYLEAGQVREIAYQTQSIR